MKRIASSILSAVLAAGAIVASSAAYAEATIYGTVRSGVIHNSSHGGAEANWDLGSVDAGDLLKDNAAGNRTYGDRLFSRIGVRASHEVNYGLTAGLHVEKRIDNWRTRHQNVWLQGAFGKLTLGQQGSPYQSAVSWDGSYFSGDTNGATSRKTGVAYRTAFDGPFSFQMMFGDDETVGNGSGSGVDEYEIAMSYSVDNVATVSLGYLGMDMEEADSMDYGIGGTVAGSLGGLTWEVGYESRDFNDNNDKKHYGFHLGYRVGDGNFYGQYEDLNATMSADDDDHLILGYAHYLGDNATIVLEHKRPDDGSNTTIGAIVVNF